MLSLAQSGLAAGKLTVFAAASLTNALQDIAPLYQRRTGVPVVLSLGASSTLAQQIDAGAPAAVFISADQKWMDYLQERNRIDPATRRDLLGNRLVLVAPRSRPFSAKLEKGFDLPRAFSGKLCTGDPAHVPVGLYAKAALERLGWWQSLAPRIVGTADVRGALAFVERGECGAGIVYETDARISRQVLIVAAFPPGSYPPVTYPVAAVRPAGREAESFLDFLSSPEARAVFERYGFTVLGR